MSKGVTMTEGARASCVWFNTLCRLLSPVVIGVSLAIGPVPGAAAAADHRASPEMMVDEFDTTLLDVMREGKRSGYQARYEALAAVMNATFDFAGMTRIAVGAAWAGLTSDQQRAIVSAFREYCIATYAAEFDAYSGEQFVTDGRRELPQGLLVTASLVAKADSPVKFGYLFHEVAGGWRVIDIYLNGTISQLAVRRSEFSSILARSGPEGLIHTLTDKAKALEEGARSKS